MRPIRTLVTFTALVAACAATLAPEPAAADGSQLLFLSPARSDGFDWSLFSIGTDGRAAPVERLASTSITCCINGGNHSGIALSPDGTRIAFSARRDGDNNDIYVADVDGARVLRVTGDPAHEYNPAWSPDGTRIAYESRRRNEGESINNQDIYVVDLDDLSETRLTTDAAQDREPTWSPDGTRIAFVSAGGGRSDVFSMHLDGSDPVNLTQDDDVDSQPAWSPDGTRIAFVKGSATARDIYVMNADGSGVEALSPSPGANRGPVWSPDGAWIAYAQQEEEGILGSGGTWELYVQDLGGGAPFQVTQLGGVSWVFGWRKDAATLIEAMSWGRIKASQR